MSRKPQSVPTPTPTPVAPAPMLPASGGAYVLTGDQLQREPEPGERAQTAPSKEA